MSERRDMLHFNSLRSAGAASSSRTQRSKPFLSVWFQCCHAYGRLTRNRDATAYHGRCPRCGASVSAGIGPGGTNRRMFIAE